MMMFLRYSFLICTFVLLVEGYLYLDDKRACKSPKYFRCANDVCLPAKWVCDGDNDCGDKSDEINCVDPPKIECKPGYRLSNNKKCIDINECNEDPNVCHQRCINTAGSYNCRCKPGYTLMNDKKTCRIESNEALMIISLRNEVRGYFLESDLSFPIAENLDEVAGVSLDDNYFYWSDITKNNSSIYIRNRDNDSEVIVTGLGFPEEIAVDWITGNIYFTDTFEKKIEVCNNDGSYRSVIISETDGGMLLGLVLYSSNGQMFWSVNGQKPYISIAGMDGKGRKRLVTENLGWPNGLAIDYPEKRLYWVDAKLQTIETVLLDGTDRRLILHLTDSYPYSISVFANRLYWSDWKKNSIQMADKIDGTNETSFLDHTDDVYGIAIYYSLLKPKYSNPCDSHPCSYLCLLATNRTYSCACPIDKNLSTDSQNCVTIIKHDHLVIATENNLVDYNHEILDNSKMIGSPIFKKIIHTAYDPMTGTILAYDRESNKIFQHNSDNNETHDIINVDNEYIGGMDFDYYGNNVYLSDVESRTLVIYSLMSRHKTIITFTEEPRDILLIPERGIMYIVFKSGETYHIDKLRMTGHGTKKPIVEGLVGPKISLAYDFEFERVYWSDQGSGCIESISVEGTDRTLLRSSLQEPMTIAVLEKNIFWTLQNSTQLWWTDKKNETFGNRHGIQQLPIDSEIMDLVIIREINTRTSHTCQINNGDCTHVCLVDVIQHNHICACPRGMILNSDKHSCGIQSACTLDEMRCSDNNACINKMQRCDGVRDCPNGEDEEQCYCKCKSCE